MRAGRARVERGISLVAGVMARQLGPVVVGKVRELERRGASIERRYVSGIVVEIGRRLVRNRDTVGGALAQHSAGPIERGAERRITPAEERVAPGAAERG